MNRSVDRLHEHQVHSLVLPSVAKFTEGHNEGVFEFYPMSQGLALTVGHALRRTIMNYAMNCSIVSVKINGVNNEFARVHGAREDMVQIISALRAMPIECETIFEGTKSMSLNISARDNAGRTITCADLPRSTDLSFPVLDYKLFDMTGSDDIQLHMWFACGSAFDSGFEFFTHFDVESIPNDIEIIKVAPNFNCCDVAVRVDTIDKGGRAYDVLRLTITTNGGKPPVAYMEEGLANFKRISDAMYSMQFSQSSANQPYVGVDLTQYKSKPLSVLTLNQAILQCLEGAGFNTVGELMDARNLDQIPGITDAVLEKIRIALQVLHPSLSLNE